MSEEINNYRTEARKFFGDDDNEERPQLEFQRLADWYKSDGCKQFKAAFKRETGLILPLNPDDEGIVEAAIPKSYRDEEKKFLDDAFYRAHAIWFLKEMDEIVNKVPRETDYPLLESAYGDVMAFVKKVVIDSVVLFEDWGNYRMGIPHVYGIYKNPVEHIMGLYQGARQLIYGPGSWGLSFSENHSDLAVAIIRMLVELRLRRGFGIMGKIRKADDTVHPILLSEILDAAKLQQAEIKFPVKLENIERINSWCNMYLHSGIKNYAWCAPRLLKFLRNFLLGGPAPGYHFTDKAGIIITQSAFDTIRDSIRQNHEGSKFTLYLLDPCDCLAVIT